MKHGEQEIRARLIKFILEEARARDEEPRALSSMTLTQLRDLALDLTDLDYPEVLRVVLGVKTP